MVLCSGDGDAKNRREISGANYSIFHIVCIRYACVEIDGDGGGSHECVWVTDGTWNCLIYEWRTSKIWILLLLNGRKQRPAELTQIFFPIRCVQFWFCNTNRSHRDQMDGFSSNGEKNEKWKKKFQNNKYLKNANQIHFTELFGAESQQSTVFILHFCSLSFEFLFHCIVEWPSGPLVGFGLAHVVWFALRK